MAHLPERENIISLKAAKGIIKRPFLTCAGTPTSFQQGAGQSGACSTLVEAKKNAVNQYQVYLGQEDEI